MEYCTGANVGAWLTEELALEKRILEEQGEVNAYNLRDLGLDLGR